MLYAALKATRRSTLLAQTEVQLKVLSMPEIEDLDVDVGDIEHEEEEEEDADTENLSETETERNAQGMRDRENAGDLPSRDARDDVLIAGTILVARSPEEKEETTPEKLTIGTLGQAGETITL